MMCTRCEDLMLKENMIDMEADYGEMWSRSWRCFNCGHRDDAIIRHHRQVHAKSIVTSPQRVPLQETIELPLASEAVNRLQPKLSLRPQAGTPEEEAQEDYAGHHPNRCSS